MKASFKNSNGFTLIEIIVIIIILSILASVAVAKYADMSRDAADGVSEGILSTLRSSNSHIYSLKILNNNTVTYTMGDIAESANIQGVTYNISGNRTLDVTIKNYNYTYTIDTLGQAPTTLPKVNFSTGEDCFIATAAYGSYLDPHVVVLRKFRDRYLLTNRIGTIFVEFYYRYSPFAAGFIEKNGILRIFTRCILTPIIYSIKYPLLFLFLIMSPVLALRLRKHIN